MVLLVSRTRAGRRMAEPRRRTLVASCRQCRLRIAAQVMCAASRSHGREKRRRAARRVTSVSVSRHAARNVRRGNLPWHLGVETRRFRPVFATFLTLETRARDPPRDRGPGSPSAFENPRVSRQGDVASGRERPIASLEIMNANWRERVRTRAGKGKEFVTLRFTNILNNESVKINDREMLRN